MSEQFEHNTWEHEFFIKSSSEGGDYKLKKIHVQVIVFLSCNWLTVIQSEVKNIRQVPLNSQNIKIQFNL